LYRLFAFIDRSNIGNAKIAGLPEDLGISTGTAFNVALLVFYIPYVLVDVPSNWAVKRVRAGVYLPALITAWGLVSTTVGFARSLTGLVVTRLLLGLFESDLLGGIVVYLAMFYRRHQMLRRIGYFYCAAPLSGAFGGLLATGLAKIQYGGYNRWPWIFFSTSIVRAVLLFILFRPPVCLYSYVSMYTYKYDIKSRRHRDDPLRNIVPLCYAPYACRRKVPNGKRTCRSVVTDENR
jgi:MFS family permease